MQAASDGQSVRLPDGKILVVGGGAELYDPATGMWSLTGSTITGDTATLLLDGTVLVTGQLSDGAAPSAQIYDPSAVTWTPTGGLLESRQTYTTTLLSDGRVLVTGGMGPNGSYDYLASAEVYDPRTGTWSVTGGMGETRGEHGISVAPGQTATLLKSGMILVVGGAATPFDALDSAELYDPTTGTWRATGSMHTPRQHHTATLLEDGRVLVVGGGAAGTPTAELYDPDSGTWSTTGDLDTNRIDQTATLLSNGEVLVTGGQSNGTLATAELYNPGSGTWSNAGAMGTSRAWHSATLLDDGRVLVAGGETLAEPTLFRGSPFGRAVRTATAELVRSSDRIPPPPPFSPRQAIRLAIACPKGSWAPGWWRPSHPRRRRRSRLPPPGRR